MFDENDVIAKRYRLLRRLGAGGMGVVWEAKDEQLGRAVALKLIIPKLARDPKKLARFETGAKAVASLSSPHIVQLIEYGVDRAPFMVMELLHGTVLRDRMDGGFRFDIRAAARIIVQTASALTTAHEQGVVHRNLKLGNIFLVEDGDEEFVKVFDFGTAKWLTGFRNANDITTMGSIMGNPDYLAPEQLSGDARSDHRADVWSLAAIAYHVITGVTPFEGEQMGAIMRSILFTNPEPPSSIDVHLPAALDELFTVALNKKRDERFQSAQQFANALCDALGVDPATLGISVRAKDSGAAIAGATTVGDAPRALGGTSQQGDAERGSDAVGTAAPEAEHGSVAPDPPNAPSAARAVVPSGPVSDAPVSDAPVSSARQEETKEPNTPDRPVPVQPTLTRASALDLPSAPVLALAGLAFVALGGGAAWFLMASPAETTKGSPATSASFGSPGPTASASSTAPAPNSATPGALPSTHLPPSAEPTTAPRPAPSATPSVKPTATVSRPPHRPWPRPDPGDIYDD